MLLIKIAEIFDRNKLNYAVAGGYAVCLYGAVRGTVDLDIVINITETDFIKAEDLLLKLGFIPRLPVKAEEIYRFRKEYMEKRNLKAWSFVNKTNPAEVVDIIIMYNLKKIKTKKINIQGRDVKIVSADDLIKMKKIAGRPQDVEDIKALEKLKK